MKLQILRTKMGRLIHAKTELKEGEVFNKYIQSRLIKNNKNVLLAITGTTGSGKSYACLRIAELWYKQQFNEEFPTDTNTCFSIEEVMERLTDKKNPVRRGEILIVEEAGTQLGNLDFQNQVSKMFTYVLQSFRSMNVCLIFNLPVLSMLNKSARLLIHAHFTTSGIDFDRNVCKLKPKFHQLNQQSGKIYPKYMRVKLNGRVVPMKKFSYGLPSDKMLKIYEFKKLKFVNELNKDFLQKIQDKRQKEKDKLNRNNMTDKQFEVFKLRGQGLTLQQVADKLGISLQGVHSREQGYIKRGFKANNTKND